MKLFIISDPVYFKAEASLINRLFEAGMPVFHLRKEGASRLDYAALLADIDALYHDRIALHQFHELILDFPSVKRLHYPERFRKKLLDKDLPRNSEDRILSTSIHNLKDLSGLTAFNYTFYGPVFDSLSKPGYPGVAGTGFLRPKTYGLTQLIALGGIDAGKIDAVRQMGFDGAAVLGAIWNDREQAINNFNKIKRQCSR